MSKSLIIRIVFTLLLSGIYPIAQSMNPNSQNELDKQHELDKQLFKANNSQEALDAINRGANIEAQNKRNRTPLHAAAEMNRADIVELLLNKNANIEATDGHYTPLHIAVDDGHTNVVILLLDKGANIEAKTSYGSTPLLTAIKNKNIEMVKLLLSKGANTTVKIKAKNFGRLQHSYRDFEQPTISEEEELTPLLIAVIQSQKKIVKLLLKYGADIDGRYKHGKSILHVAVENCHGRKTIIQLLLDKGAPANLHDVYNYFDPRYNYRDPLYWLATNTFHAKVAELLLKNGADPFFGGEQSIFIPSSSIQKLIEDEKSGTKRWKMTLEGEQNSPVSELEKKILELALAFPGEAKRKSYKNQLLKTAQEEIRKKFGEHDSLVPELEEKILKFAFPE